MHFTPIEQRMINLLSDGLRHTKDEVFACVQDQFTGKNGMVNAYISKIRAKLNPIGEHVVCEYYLGRYYYRHVRLLANPYKG